MGLVTPDFGLVFWMVLAFTIVLFILKKFAWKPILQSLKDRENSIAEALSAAQSAKEEMAKLSADNERILREAKIERDNLIKEARETKDKIITDAKNEAKVEANKLIENARIDIENEKNKALSEIKAQVAIISVEIAEKILKTELADSSKQKAYIDKLINDFKFN